MIQPTRDVTPEMLAELQVAIDKLDEPRDPERMKKAAERMDRMREELRERIGTVDLAVQLIRETRNE